MRVVLDTGIFISALISPNSNPSKAIELWLNKDYELISSEWQLDELKRVSRYERIQKIINQHQAGRIINQIRANGTIVSDLPEIDISPDPDDNPILATAIKGKVFYLVSGDKKDLLDLERVKDIEIINVADFVELF